MKSRAIRRHHYKRLKKKRADYWYASMERLSPRHHGIATNTPARCSCRMCGNIRKYWREQTRQELKNERELDQQLEELNGSE